VAGAEKGLSVVSCEIKEAREEIRQRRRDFEGLTHHYRLYFEICAMIDFLKPWDSNGRCKVARFHETRVVVTRGEVIAFEIVTLGAG